MTVVLAAAVVETVADLVTNYRADAAIVHGIVGVGIEERWLQDGGRKHDFVFERAVIRVHRLRRHAPFSTVDRFAQLGEIALEIEAADAVRVADQGRHAKW